MLSLKWIAPRAAPIVQVGLCHNCMQPDAIEAYDPATGTSSTQIVQQVFVNHDRDLVDVTLRTVTASDQAAGTVVVGADDVPTRAALQAARQHQLATPTTRDETIHTTLKHPWLTADRSWIAVSGLHPGERVERAAGTTAVMVSIRIVPGAAAMWDLTVSRVHTFAVGMGAYVVHNCGGGGKVGGGNDVFDRITPTAKDMPNTKIPATFKLRVADGEYWVNSNATEHMEQYIRGALNKGVSPFNIPQLSANYLRSFVHAVDEALPNLVEGQQRQVIQAGGWEIGFDTRDRVIFHAIMQGW